MRGIRKSDFARRNFYDVCLPTLVPSAGAVKAALAAKSDRYWARFVRRYRGEMTQLEHRARLDLLAAHSHDAEY